MTFVSTVDQAEAAATLTPHDPLLDAETTFGESFTAGLGLVIDEELSISSALNNEGYAEREEIARGMRDNGFDFTPYTDDTGVIDYNRLAAETDFGIKTDRELYDAKREILDRRRAYSQDVIERGSGFAQFLGSMNGYLLDPINVATLPLGASASALRGLSTMARVAHVARTEALIGAGAELAIQPLVYAHKNEIGSPYEMEDAIAAIATASLGSAVIGGAGAGIAGVLRRAAGIADVAPGRPDLEGSRQILNRVAADIEANPERMEVTGQVDAEARHFSARTNAEIAEEIAVIKAKGPTTEDDAIRLEAARAVVAARKGRWQAVVDREIEEAVQAEKARLLAGTSELLSRGDRQQLRAELEDLRYRRNRVEPSPPEVAPKKGVSARKAKADALKRAQAEADAEVADLTRQIDAIEARLEAAARGSEAEAELTRVEQGKYSKSLRQALDQIKHRRLVELDADYMRRLEETRATQHRTVATAETYGYRPDEPEDGILPLEALDDEETIFSATFGDESDVLIEMSNGERVSAKQFLQEQDELIEGLESVRVCAYG